MSRTTTKTGDVTVTVDNGLDELAVRLRTRLPPAVHAAMLQAAREALAEIVTYWPVRSGRSRDGFHVEETARGAFVVNDVPYSTWLRPRGADPTTSFDLIVGPAYDRATRSLLEALPGIVEEAAHV